jgi:hypothetical protein
MGALQLKSKQARQQPSGVFEKIDIDPRCQVYEELVGRRNNSQIFRSPHWGALEEAAPTAT